MTSSLALPASGGATTLVAASVSDIASADALVIGATSKDKEIASLVTEISGAAELLPALAAVGATGAAGEVTTLPAPAELGVARVVVVGLGEADGDFDAEAIRRAAGSAARGLAGVEKVAVDLPLATEAALGFALGAYAYPGLKSVPPTKLPVAEAHVVGATADELARVQIVVDQVCFARDLVNTNSKDLYPEFYANLVAERAAEIGLEVEVYDYERLVAEGFGGIAGVGQGSARKPRLVRMAYRPEGATAHVGLVGKGITFDTGGISIKPSASMDDMISDMGGSAGAINALFAAARLGVKVNITAYIPMAENMPDGNSYRPGDILTLRNGKTVEITNTDAEGRLLLADALAAVSEEKPDYILEMATLTGAQLVALGARTTGVMGSDELRDRVAELGRSVGEGAWAMPIPEEVAEAVKSPVADLVNSARARFAGMMSAGAFLSNFVGEGIQWAHLDIAGPAYNNSGAYGYIPARATGAPVRTVLAALEDIASR